MTSLARVLRTAVVLWVTAIGTAVVAELFGKPAGWCYLAGVLIGAAVATLAARGWL